MEILIDNQHPNPDLMIKKVRAKAKAILNALASRDIELSLVLVDDPTIAKYNEQYLGRSGPTNVIAFPMQEGDFADINVEMLGDVMISLDTCLKEANQAGSSLEKRFDELLIHGILHLFDYDHVDSEEQALRMEKKSQELLDLLLSLNDSNG